MIRDAAESGDYATTSEVIREALRDWKQNRRFAVMQDDELRSLIRAGMESGKSIPAEPLFDRLQAKYAAMQKPE